MPEEHVPYYIAFQTRQETYNHNDYESLPCFNVLKYKLICVAVVLNTESV